MSEEQDLTLSPEAWRVAFAERRREALELVRAGFFLSIGAFAFVTLISVVAFVGGMVWAVMNR